ncbi:hypothetical protein M3578_21535, partial [Bacillus velezensis]|nr:hypothetical protein [Bacillus velezensis]
QKALGSFYLFGLEEMGSDAREAEKWLSIAVGRGDKESKKLLDLARKAKKEDEEDWKWRTQWRDVYYGLLVLGLSVLRRLAADVLVLLTGHRATGAAAGRPPSRATPGGLSKFARTHKPNNDSNRSTTTMKTNLLQRLTQGALVAA